MAVLSSNKSPSLKDTACTNNFDFEKGLQINDFIVTKKVLHNHPYVFSRLRMNTASTPFDGDARHFFAWCSPRLSVYSNGN